MNSSLAYAARTSPFVKGSVWAAKNREY